jgi:hypothetical protein
MVGCHRFSAAVRHLRVCRLSVDAGGGFGVTSSVFPFRNSTARGVIVPLGSEVN